MNRMNEMLYELRIRLLKEYEMHKNKKLKRLNRTAIVTNMGLENSSSH